MEAGGKLHAISTRHCMAGLGVMGSKCMTEDHPTIGKVESCMCNTELCNGSPDEPHEGKNQSIQNYRFLIQHNKRLVFL